MLLLYALNSFQIIKWTEMKKKKQKYLSQRRAFIHTLPYEYFHLLCNIELMKRLEEKHDGFIFKSPYFFFSVLFSSFILIFLLIILIPFIFSVCVCFFGLFDQKNNNNKKKMADIRYISSFQVIDKRIIMKKVSLSFWLIKNAKSFWSFQAKAKKKT